MNIKPCEMQSSSRTGTLTGITVSEINEILGFEPNADDDPDKVEHSWAFQVDGTYCGIWDYKGSHRWNQFSTFGPDVMLRKVFGKWYTPNGF